MEIARRIATVRGTVQGVGFRYAARREAIRLEITGSVRNLPDGSVEVDYEGTDAAVRAFEAWLNVGPPAGRVLSVTVEDASPTGGSEFSIVS